eukprot:CAMPEP_0168468350 /NCGR_PEP_ID=MMETSP0228-20121227/57661_1 /TAXON_ID=133427 /ORGANISM="Protoceratium reticulatum, Strain CCCM 535 (=CCMP 1889)" /LENGTH=38 /DNA_ID= /DNA_START= /DNA_END= /DNA_ORIENTATION=
MRRGAAAEAPQAVGKGCIPCQQAEHPQHASGHPRHALG